MSAFAGYGQVTETAQPAATEPYNSATFQSLTSLERTLWRPVIDFLTSFLATAPDQPVTATSAFVGPELSLVVPERSLPPCSVAPLDPIDDPAAQQLEASIGSDVVDIQDMVPAAARALDRFQSKVESVGGTIVLKSAYRPAAYQKHLQDVWYKWMGELRDDDDPACQDLRAQVQDEFTRHRLIETQHPVAVSDHTRGLAFDATVELPMKAGRRLTLDGLAHLAGLLRPAIVADPVHFKYLGGTSTAALRRRHNA